MAFGGAGALQDACVLTAWRQVRENAVLQCCALIVLYFSFAVLGIKLRSVICQRCFCLRMPVWVSAPATTIQSVI